MRAAQRTIVGPTHIALYASFIACPLGSSSRLGLAEPERPAPATRLISLAGPSGRRPAPLPDPLSLPLNLWCLSEPCSCPRKLAPLLCVSTFLQYRFNERDLSGRQLTGVHRNVDSGGAAADGACAACPNRQSHAHDKTAGEQPCIHPPLPLARACHGGGAGGGDLVKHARLPCLQLAPLHSHTNCAATRTRFSYTGQLLQELASG